MRQVSIIALAAVGLPFAAASLSAQQSLPLDTSSRAPLALDPAVLHDTLDNGLRYFVKRNGRPEKRAELRLVVNAGSVLEDDDQLGLAHFVEHMAFNGTRRFPKNELVRYLESVGMRFGADLNAYTSFDETVYDLTIPTDSATLLPRGIEILADWAAGQTFDTTEIERERGVVIEEWRLGRGAGRRISDQQFPVIFHGSRYATRLPIGDREALERFTPAALIRFYREWYRPDLMSVVAVGDFDPDSVAALIRRAFAPLPRPATSRPRPLFPVPGHDTTLVTVVTDAEATSSSVALYVKRQAGEHATVGSMRRDLVHGLMTRMLNERFQKIGLSPDAPFASAGAGQGAWVRTAELSLLSALAKPGRMEDALDALLTEAERARVHGFTASELQRAKANLLRSYERSYEEREKIPSAAHAAELISYALGEGASPGIAAEYELARQFVPTVSVDEVNAVAREWLSGSGRVIAASAPQNDSVDVATSAELRAVVERVGERTIAAYADSVSEAPLIARLPEPGRIAAEREEAPIGVRVWTLSNGARVIVKPTDFQNDQVLFTAFSPGGTSLAPDSIYRQIALADYVISTGGVGAHSVLDLRRKLAGKAVSVSPNIGTYEDGLSGSASPKDLETLFQLVHLFFTAPRADSIVFEALRENSRAVLGNRGNDPNAVFSDTIAVTMSRGHPRALPLTPARMDSASVQRSIDFYRERFADAADFTFVIVGSFDADSIRSLVERYLASLPAAGRAERPRDLGIRPPDGVVEKSVRKGVERKSRTVLAFTGPATSSPAERAAISVLASVLEIELRDRLREALGGTYGVNVGSSITRVPVERYEVTISFESDPERADELTREVFAQIDSLRARGAPEKILSSVREIERREHETRLRQNGFWIGQLATRTRYREPLASLLDIPDRIAAVDSGAVRDAARRYLRLDQYARFTLLPETPPAPAPTP